MTELSFIFISICGFCISTDLISPTAAAPLDLDISNFENQLLSGLGINDPMVSPSISKHDIVIPDDIRSMYTSMLRAHRTKRMISKGIHKNPDICGDIQYTDPSHQAFTFDISSIPSESDILMAELRVYKERPNESNRGRNRTHRHPVNGAKVSIHQIGKNSSDAEHGERPDRFLMYGEDSNSTVDLVDERVVSVDSFGWTIFDVTTAVRHWLVNPANNQGLEMRVDPFRPGRYANRIADSVRTSMIRHGRHDLPETEVDRPILTIYTVKYAPKVEPLDCEEGGVEPTACCRTSRYVDFRETSWTNRWIIEPAGFEAFDCVGPCKNHKRNGHRSLRDIFSLPHHFPSGPSSLQQCGASKSSSLPMMYLVESNGVTQLEVSEMPDMITEECACMR